VQRVDVPGRDAHRSKLTSAHDLSGDNTRRTRRLGTLAVHERQREGTWSGRFMAKDFRQGPS
jgi:hypothetical protein